MQAKQKKFEMCTTENTQYDSEHRSTHITIIIVSVMIARLCRVMIARLPFLVLHRTSREPPLRTSTQENWGTSHAPRVSLEPHQP